MTPTIAPNFDRDGFATVADLIDAATVDRLITAVDQAPVSGGETIGRGGERPGRRDILRSLPEVRALAGSPALLAVARSVLGPGTRAVRGLWFDKTAGANWGVPWHQDTTIAVRERAEVAGFGPWTVKAGIPHVRPPDQVLGRMVTIRVHLDDCGAGNGPLEVVPGSHASGRFDAARTAEWLARGTVVSCPVGRGGAVVMRPLILHASSAATQPAHRRVVHLEYASGTLPEPLEWFDLVGEDV